jgi:hypothetical protein
MKIIGILRFDWYISSSSEKWFGISKADRYAGAPKGRDVEAI